MATRIQLRRDTAANWTAANPILADGEQALETDTGALKIGNGLTAWNSLVYRDSRYAPAAHVGSRDGHPLATATLDGLMAAADKARLEAFRTYMAPTWTAYTFAATTGWQATTLSAPVITIPTLGPAPVGFEWRIDVVSSIRIQNGSAGHRSYFFSAGFDATRTTSVQGGGDMPSLFQAALPLGAYDLVPPATDRNFTVDFTLWANNSGDVTVSPGPYPTAKCYLAKL